MKKKLTVLLGLLAFMVLTACAGAAAPSGSMAASSASASSAVAEPARSEESSGSGQTEEQLEGGKTAVVYFSATGNTKKIAEKISSLTTAQLLEIQPAQPYSTADLNYNDNSCRANQEMNDEKSRPAIANDLSELKNCDTIYIGYPIWWGTAPRIIQTLLESYDLSGKNIYLFCTSGSSGVERSVTDLQKLYLKLNIQSGKRFAANSSENAIQTWLNSLN